MREEKALLEGGHSIIINIVICSLHNGRIIIINWKSLSTDLYAMIEIINVMLVIRHVNCVDFGD
jgi:hypothetical protein